MSLRVYPSTASPRAAWWPFVASEVTVVVLPDGSIFDDRRRCLIGEFVRVRRLEFDDVGES